MNLKPEELRALLVFHATEVQRATVGDDMQGRPISNTKIREIVARMDQIAKELP